MGTLGDLIAKTGVFVDGDWIETKDQDPEGKVRLIQLADIGVGEFLDRSCRFLTDETAQRLKCTLLQDGDVLIARMPEPLGRACVFPANSHPCITVVDVCIIRSGTDTVDHRWLMWFVNSPEFRAQVASLQGGVTRKRISRSNLATIQMPVPPGEEQTRIADQVEALLTDLDAAVAALKRVQANLKRYRASVLKAACEGRLISTEAELARKEGRSYESGEQLLQRILKERRAKWESDQLAKMHASGKPPKNDDWKLKYKDPAPPIAAKLPGLPDGWTWATLDALAETVGGITKGQKRREGDVLRSVPYLRVANVQRGFIDLTEIKEIEALESEIDELCLQPDDILFNEGGDRDKLGRGWIWEGQIAECIHQNHVYRARLINRDVEPRFVSYFANSEGQQYFQDEGKQTTNLASINLTKLRAFPVPLPPYAEQRRIVEELQRQLDYVATVETSTSLNLRRADRLRQSILKRAFEGKLVPQDPNDEPALVLLERNRAERKGAKSAEKVGDMRQTKVARAKGSAK